MPGSLPQTREAEAAHARDAQLLSTAPHSERDQQAISSLDELVDLGTGIVERVPEPFHEPDVSLRPPVHFREVGNGHHPAQGATIDSAATHDCGTLARRRPS
jgi:hypothetical protein